MYAPAAPRPSPERYPAGVRRFLPVLALLLGLNLPFLGKPVHLDDANFLVLAEGARLDPWRPHAVEVNWQGRLQPAFEVLSNPPGIGWFLAPVVGQPDWLQHLWVLLWLPLAAWGAWRLGDRLAGRPAAAAILLCGSPVALLAAQSRMPDLPLLACVLAGMAGTLGPGSLRRRAPALLLLGCAALFRYSGAALVPLVVAAELLRPAPGPAGGRVPRALLAGLLAASPLALLVLHDLHAYGQPHILAMVDFQGEAGGSGRDALRKVVAAVAMLGGAAALPVLAWARPRRAAAGALLGLGLGALGAALSGQAPEVAALTLAFAAAGGAVLGGASPGRIQDREAAVLGLWLFGGLAFFLFLRFAAARYWLPFFAPAVLLPLRQASPRLVAAACVLTPGLGLLLALDDLELARAQEALAAEVIAAAEEFEAEGTGLVAGHWGFQHHLEAAGWAPLEEDAPVPRGTLLAVSAVAWPQSPGPGCLAPLGRWTATDAWPGPRVHTREGAANVHAFVLSARPPVESYAPWGLGGDALDEVSLWRGCAAAEAPALPPTGRVPGAPAGPPG